MIIFNVFTKMSLVILSHLLFTSPSHFRLVLVRGMRAKECVCTVFCENCRIGFLTITPKIFVVEKNQVHFRVQEVKIHKNNLCFVLTTYEKRKSIGDLKLSLSPKILILQQN